MRTPTPRHSFARRFLFRSLFTCIATASAGTASAACLTLEEAALAAVAEALPLSRTTEHAGALYALDGCHYFTTPQTSGGADTVKVRVQFPGNARLAGIYHTHPNNGSTSALFSPDDVAIQIALNLPSFIGVVRDSSVRVLDGTVSRRAKRSGTPGRLVP